ncbi:MAG: hypothetical protein IKV05_00945 [Bacteroidales bacterium]|nr:hypothetical protein [Bacteroidales bacterium]
MKKKLIDFQGVYQSPEVTEVKIASEGIMCASGNTIEDFGLVEDQDGWAI